MQFKPLHLTLDHHIDSDIKRSATELAKAIRNCLRCEEELEETHVDFHAACEYGESFSEL